MLDILNEVIEIPFDLFWNKFVEKGGLDLYKHQAGAVWFAMDKDQREAAFEDIASCQELNDIFAVSYLKSFM